MIVPTYHGRVVPRIQYFYDSEIGHGIVLGFV